MSERRSFPWITLLLLALLVGLILAVRYLPWWGVALVIGLPILLWKYIAALIFAVMVRQTARELARALLGATVEVHALKPVPPPDPAQLAEWMRDEDEDAEEFEELI